MMPEPEPPRVAPFPAFDVETETKADGRLVRYYSWPADAPDQPDQPDRAGGSSAKAAKPDPAAGEDRTGV